MTLSALVVSLQLPCPVCAHPSVRRDPGGSLDLYVCPQNNSHRFRLHDGHLIRADEAVAPSHSDVVRRAAAPPPIVDFGRDLRAAEEQLALAERWLAIAERDAASARAQRDTVLERVERLRGLVARGG